MFTTAEQLKILYLLGYPAKTIQAGSLYYSSKIVSRISDHETETETRVKSLMNRVADLDTKLEEASGRFMAESVEGIKLNPRESELLKKERRRLIKEIGVILDIRPQHQGGAVVGVMS